jgi:hypothetical protein
VEDGSDQKREGTVDFIERKDWSPSYLNLGYFVFFSDLIVGHVRLELVVKPQV